MKNLILFLCIAGSVFIMGCKPYTEGLTGNYTTKKYSFFTQYYLSYFKNITFVLNSTLKINADSTYVLHNCGNIEEGHWELRHDSLLLFCETNRYVIDSFNKEGLYGKFLDCGNGLPEVFIIDEHILKKQYKSNGKTFLFNLEKLK